MGYSQNWSFNTQGKSYSLTVGCGGTPAKWKTSTSTPSYKTTWSNIMCFPGGSYGLGSVFVLGVGIIGLGLVIMIWQAIKRPAYFRGETLSLDAPASLRRARR